jgi:hypothetical protein
MILAGIWIAHQDIQFWPYLPHLQAEEDVERAHPPAPQPAKSADDIGWDNSESRYSLQQLALVTVDPLPAVLADFGFPYRSVRNSFVKPAPVLSRIVYPLTDHLRVRTRIVVLRAILLLIVGVQWFLVGVWVDRTATSRGRLLKMPPLQISGLALLAQVLTWIYEAAWSNGWNTLSSTTEPIARLCLLAGFLLWIWWGVVTLWRLALWLRNRFRPKEVSC